jgi:superfamily II DNA/RNA helicase
LDLIGVASTGAGKTFGFLLPMVASMERSAMFLSLWPRRDQAGPSALVIAPTRELAQQIYQQLAILLKGLPSQPRLHAACVLGGQSVKEDPTLLSALFRGVAAIVATPGRLLNLLDKRKTHLRRLSRPPGASVEDAKAASGVLVLDEADRLLALGFEQPLRRIFAHITSAPPEPGAAALDARVQIDASKHQHQTLLFSASWSAEVQGLATGILRPDAVARVAVGGGRAEQLAANTAIEQRIEVLPRHGSTNDRVTLPLKPKVQERIDSDKLERLIQLLQTLGHGRDEKGLKRKATGADSQVHATTPPY